MRIEDKKNKKKTVKKFAKIVNITDYVLPLPMI